MSSFRDEVIEIIHNQFEKLDAQRESLKEQHPFWELILKNFKLHYLLEAAGFPEVMLSDQYMIDHPVYRMYEGEEAIFLNGKQEVTDFYFNMRDTKINVIWLPDYDFQVSDWGFSGEATHVAFVPGSELSDLQRRFAKDYDPETTYVLTRRMAFHFPSAPDGRLAGEFVYTDPTNIKVEAVAPEDVITPEEMTELLTPMLVAEGAMPTRAEGLV